MESDQPPRSKKKNKQTKAHPELRWAVQAFVTTLVVSMVLSYSSSQAITGVGYMTAFAILALFIVLGIVFDIIGVAVTAADEKPFNAMASRRVHGAKDALMLIKNADRVSSICNDVIGDIAGIISGSTSAAVTTMLIMDLNLSVVATGIVVTGLVSAFMVGGKALGKTLAINYSTDIVHLAGRAIYLFKKLFRLPWRAKR